MALMKCPECGQEVSDKATTCIHCGCPINVENVVTVRLPADKNIVVTLSYQVTDSNGNVLAEGVSGQVLTFTLDEPTELSCRMPKRDYTPVSVNYVPRGPVEYNVVKREKGFSSFIEMVDTKEQGASETGQSEQSSSGGSNSFGIFLAVLIAIIVAVWLIPQLFTWEVTFSVLPGK